MKRTLSIIALTAVFAACKISINEPEKIKNMVLVDTTGLYKTNTLTTLDGKYVIVENGLANANNNPMGKSVANAKIIRKRIVTNSDYYSQANSNESAAIPKDKGMSHAAKGVIVGAGTGAITGALINKEHRGTGAIIGALIAAGSGYVIGRVTDKKTGRVDRARARRAANQ